MPPTVVETTLGGKKIALPEGGVVTRKPIFPTPPPPSLAAVTGGGSSGRGRPTCRAGGGGFNPTSMAQNDTHFALIILTTQMWGGGGIRGGKNFFGPNFVFLCLCANIHSYTKQRARHGTPFLQPPPPFLRRASMSPPPPPPAEQFSGCPDGVVLGQGFCIQMGGPEAIDE